MESISIKEILRCRGYEKCSLPLWSLRLNDVEYKKLKETLEYAYRTNLHTKYERETTLYYAEWWRREHKAGHPSSRLLLQSLNLPVHFEELFYSSAKKGAQKLGIKFIKNNSRTFYFRTILIQGGLPLGYIQNNEFSNYKRFLISLIKDVKATNTDWCDAEYIESLSCYNYLPQIFRNEEMLELSLQIARAIVHGEDDLLPYDINEKELKSLTQELKQEFKKSEPKASFKINWYIIPNEKVFKLHYDVECPKIIDPNLMKDNSLEDSYTLSFYIKNKNVATYKKITSDNDEAYYRRIDFRKEIFEWAGEPIIGIQIKGDNNSIINYSIPRSFAPDLDYPQMFQLLGERWMLKRNRVESNSHAILYSSEWESPEDAASESIILNGQAFKWLKFESVTALKNIINGEQLVFNNMPSLYFVEIVNSHIDWLLKSNYKLLTRVPKFLVFDSENEIVNKKQYTVFYRGYKSTLWNKFEHDFLPNGLLEIKVVFPDGKFEIEKFYFLKELKCNYLNSSSTKGEIEWQLSEGIISMFRNEKLNDEVIGKNHFLISKTDNSTAFPESVSFRIQLQNIQALEIEVGSPLKGTILSDDSGGLMTSKKIVTLDSLYRFKVVVAGYESIPVEICYEKSERIEPVILRVNLKKGIHYLSLFEEFASKLFLLYGFNSFDRKSSIKITFGKGSEQKSIWVRRFNLDSIIENGSLIVLSDDFKSDKEMLIENYIEDLYCVPINTLSSAIEVHKLIKSNNNFSLPNSISHNEVIVFSGKNAIKKIIPKLYIFTHNEDISTEDRKAMANENIEKLKEALCQETIFKGDTWAQTIKYFDVVVEYNLPFRTFNCFKAISRSSQLLIRLLFTLAIDPNRKSLWFSNIRKFEEEFASAYHWIDKEIWSKEFIYLIQTIPDILKESAVKALLDTRLYVFDLTLGGNIEELIKYALDGDICKTNSILSREKVQEIRSKISGRMDNNNDLPRCRIRSNEYFNEEGATPYQRACLLSPVKAGENLMAVTNDLWKYDREGKEVRRTIIFYRSLFPEIYTEILKHTVKQINYKSNL